MLKRNHPSKNDGGGMFGGGVMGGSSSGKVLPMTGYNRNKSWYDTIRSYRFFGGNKNNHHHHPASSFYNNDGSASSINIHPSVSQVWDRASTPTKITWIAFISSIFGMYFGYRYIRYYNAGLSIRCGHESIGQSCILKLVHIGYIRPTTIQIGRHQIIRTEAVKVQKDGTYVSGNASLKVEYMNNNNRNSKGKNKNNNKYEHQDSLSYKGPDENGHYLSYAIYFRDKDPNMIYQNEIDEILDQEYDLKNIVPYVTKMDTTTTTENKNEYRLVLKQQVPQLIHTKRRARAAITKIDSYIHKRRHKLIVKENNGPQWQGVIMVVISSITFFICIMIGQFADEKIIRGSHSSSNKNTNNKIRRNPPPNGGRQNQNQQQQLNHNNGTTSTTFQRQTPSRYEVSTKPAVRKSTAAILGKNVTVSTNKK